MVHRLWLAALVLLISALAGQGAIAQSKPGGPSYARDVAPVFVANCYGCHGGGNSSGGFSLASFERLMQGGNSGEVITPGEPDASLLIDKLRGNAGARMPLRKAPLDEAAIARIEAWIKAGAKFDGDNPAEPTDKFVRLSAAARMTHEELFEERGKLALANWELALPGRKPMIEQSPATAVLTTGGEELAEKVISTADDVQRDLAKTLRIPGKGPLIKGRLTIFAFEKRYDYGEFGRMVEKRELPKAWRGHARFNALDAYVCLVVPRDEEYSLAAELARQTMDVYLQSRGDFPAWFTRGSALAMAARLEKKAPEVVELLNRQRELAGSAWDPKPLWEGKLPDEEFEPLAAGVAGLLLTDITRYRKLLDAVADGKDFDEALKAAYGPTPDEVYALWRKKAGR